VGEASSTTTTTYVLVKYGRGGSGVGDGNVYELAVNGMGNPTFVFRVDNSPTSTIILTATTTNVVDSQWHYLVAERDSAAMELRLYVIDVKFGTMIEVVRACLRAAPLAAIAEFFSFGTNDLTQATFSFSREDAENKFLPTYAQLGILRDNPFEVLDVKGVGRLMQLAIHAGREARPELHVGICGEHGGQPDSIRFCHFVGLDYVSCSGPRVPIARLAAAQARLKEDEYDDRVFA
jgi:phosphoenolpyruvate-protein kinase (PTS system EI component)